MCLNRFSRHHLLIYIRYWRPRRGFRASRYARLILLLHFFPSSHLQANQHTLPYKLDFENVGVLPEGILGALLVAVMLALFVAIRVSLLNVRPYENAAQA
jgi:hypothetical protein